MARPCRRCGEKTDNYYVCDDCAKELIAQGVDPDELYERELDCWYAYNGH